jgi:hypothetical protein
MGVLLEVETVAVETRRRSLLAQSDELLDRVEELRLTERRAVPDPLREAIRQLQARLGRADPPTLPATVRAAHELVLAVQQRLMAANPRNPSPRPHPGRGSGQPVTAPVRGGGSWKFLALPPLPGPAAALAWSDLIEGTVERAWDRWAYAQHHAVRAAHDGAGAALAAAALRAAWTNYWELTEEAERLRGRPRPAVSEASRSRAGSGARRP